MIPKIPVLSINRTYLFFFSALEPKRLPAFICISCLFWFCNGNVFAARKISITAVGDIYISGRLLNARRHRLAEIRLQGDIVFGNFEGVLSERTGEQERKSLKLTMPFDVKHLLKANGFTALGLSNNHVFDAGVEGYRRTHRSLNSLFHISGFDSDGILIQSGNMKIRLIAFTWRDRNNVLKINEARRLIRSFSEDIIIVSAHMGAENFRSPIPNGRMEYHGLEKRGNVRQFARACIEAGADLVIGHGTHFLRQVEIYRRRVILYSLGNFIFDYPGVEHRPPLPTAVITLTLDRRGRLTRGRVHSYIFSQGLPVRDKKQRAYRLLLHLAGKDRRNFLTYFGKVN